MSIHNQLQLCSKGTKTVSIDGSCSFYLFAGDQVLRDVVIRCHLIIMGDQRRIVLVRGSSHTT